MIGQESGTVWPCVHFRMGQYSRPQGGANHFLKKIKLCWKIFHYYYSIGAFRLHEPETPPENILSKRLWLRIFLGKGGFLILATPCLGNSKEFENHGKPYNPKFSYCNKMLNQNSAKARVRKIQWKKLAKSNSRLTQLNRFLDEVRMPEHFCLISLSAAETCLKWSRNVDFCEPKAFRVFCNEPNAFPRD